MNRIGTFQLAVMFCGCFLGAGFLSGNELWQFFAVFGIKGLIGCILSVALIGLFCGFIIEISIVKKTENPERVLLPSRLHKSSMLFGVLQALLVFAIVVIMVSGSSTLVHTLTDINRNLVGVLFCIALAIFVILGTEKIVGAFSVLIPFISVASVIIGIIVITQNFNTFNFPESSSSGNPLLNNWISSMIAYISYSIFSSVGVFSAVSSKIENKKSLWSGIILGSIIMAVMATAIIFVVWAVPNAMSAELPMLNAALSIGKISGIIYAVLLFLGMFGAALSCYMSLTNYFRIKFVLKNNLYRMVVIITAILAFLGSIFGFGDLVGTIYPIFGYLGIAVLVLLAVNFIKLKFIKQKSV